MKFIIPKNKDILLTIFLFFFIFIFFIFFFLQGSWIKQDFNICYM